MQSALTKPEIAALASSRGRPISASLTATIHAVTGGCPRTVEVAVTAAQRTEADGAVTKIVADAVYADHVNAIRDLDETGRIVVTLAHFGVGSDVDVLSDLVDTAVDIRTVLDDAVAAGLLGISATALPDVDRALTDVLGKRTLTAVLTRLVEYRCKTDSLDESTAVLLVQAGIRHPELAGFLVDAAGQAQPRHASSLYELAVSAGAEPLPLCASRAETAALLGDLDASERFCDSVLEQHDSVGDAALRTAVRVAATVGAERGMSSRSAALYTWLGSERAGADTDLAVTSMLVAGDRAAADTMMASGGAALPTSSGAAIRLLADGLRHSVDAVTTAEATAAGNALMRAVSLSGSGYGRVVPESAAAVAVLFALHSGDLARAESTALHALTDSPPDATRLSLLLAWTTMLSGDLAATQARLDGVQVPASHSRNQLFLHGLRVGIARRSGDAGSLSTAWNDAQDVISRYSADLLSLLPIGELWLGAVRVGQPERISHLVAQSETVIAGLGEPLAWTSAFHWYGVQAAILAEHPAELVPHARALAEAADSNHYSATLAAAGRAWLAVLQGHPNVGEVEAAAQALTRFGLSWDGARLASEAALRVSDTREATALLQVARSLRQPTSTPDSVAEEPKGSLSAREAEVAELLVLGVTYREAGARLYISAKTVEHHVARIRRRLGAGSRSELLSMLRAMGYGTGSTEV